MIRLLIIFWVVATVSGASAGNETRSGGERSLEERLLRPDLTSESRFEAMTFRGQPGLDLATLEAGRHFDVRPIKPEQAVLGGRGGFRVPSPPPEAHHSQSALADGTGQTGMRLNSNAWASRRSPTAPRLMEGGERFGPANRTAVESGAEAFSGAFKSSPLTGKLYTGPETREVRSDLQIIHEALSKAKPEDLPGHSLSIEEIREILNRN